ncbi:MAG: lipid-binding SYLF domain-containing protein [Thermohalobaculum sp.]
MFGSLRGLSAVVLAALFVGGCVSPQGATTQDKRHAILQMRSETLAKLYELESYAKTRIGKSVGYAVFSNIGVNLIFLSAASGYGVVEDKGTGKRTYMKMASGGLGIGLGVKDFRGIFVFTSRNALEQFVESGWDASAQADAAAKAGDKGGAWAGAVDVAPGVKLYQITEHGLALQATIQGTKYWKDDELNS